MILKQVRVPRENMLSKYAKINKHNEFIKIGDEKIAYVAMLKIRNVILQGTPIVLARISTIAIRYSLQR